MGGAAWWDARARGFYWCVSSCRPLHCRYKVKAITEVAHRFVLNEERRRFCFIFLVCFEKKKSFGWLAGFAGLRSFCLNSYMLLYHLPPALIFNLVHFTVICGLLSV